MATLNKNDDNSDMWIKYLLTNRQIVKTDFKVISVCKCIQINISRILIEPISTTNKVERNNKKKLNNLKLINQNLDKNSYTMLVFHFLF